MRVISLLEVLECEEYNFGQKIFVKRFDVECFIDLLIPFEISDVKIRNENQFEFLFWEFEEVFVDDFWNQSIFSENPSVRFKDVFAFLEYIHIDFISYDESSKSHQSLSFDLSYSFSGEWILLSDFLQWCLLISIESKFSHQNESLFGFAVEEYILELSRF